MAKKVRKNKQEKLTLSVLGALAAGTTVLVSLSGTASATTLSEYKAQLSGNGGTVVAESTEWPQNFKTIDVEEKVAELKATGTGEAVYRLKDGAKSSGKVVHAVSNGTIVVMDTPYEGEKAISEWSDEAAGHGVIKSDAVVDLTKDVFFSEGENSEILFENGKAQVVANRLYGQGNPDGKIHASYGNRYEVLEDGRNRIYPEFSSGNIEIGDVDEYKNWKEEHSGAHATLQLIGNTKFNTNGWTNETGETINGKNFIVVRKNGILEADSAQIFNFGLGDGTAISTGGVRKDANDAILFESGVVLLDDKKYNNAYLTDANAAIKLADSGNTVVEVKSDAQRIDVGAQGMTYDISVVGAVLFPVESGINKNFDLNDGIVLSYVKNNAKWNQIKTDWSYHTYAIENGTKVKPMTLGVGFLNDGYDIASIVHVNDSTKNGAGNIVESTDSMVDLTDVIFKVVPATGVHHTYYDGSEVDNRNTLSFCNGTTLVKASNLYGDEKNIIEIGESSDYYTGMADTFNIPATLKLVGNEKFNAIWKTDAGDTINGKNFIVINPKGTLEANSAQIFTIGLGEDGNIMSPKSIRVDADNAIYFKAGVLLLDDERYNIAYLDEANKMVQAADGGTTVVEVKNTAEKVEGNPNAESTTEPTMEPTNDSVIRDIGFVPNDSYFAPVTTNNVDILLGDGTEANSNVDKLNAQSLDMAEPAPGRHNTISIKGKQFRLGSSTFGQQLLTVFGKKPAQPVKISVYDGGVFALGTGNTSNDVYADITLGSSAGSDTSQFNVMAGIKTINSLLANVGTSVIIAQDTMLNSPTVTLNGATVHINGILNITGTATISNGSTIYVGDASSAGKMIVSGDITALMGASIFMDPVWQDGTEITDASQLAFTDTDISYNLVVGQNSVASIGTDDVTEAANAFAQTQLNWGENDITAALYLAQPVTLDSNVGLTVDGSLTSYSAPVANSATFAANSLLMVDTEALNGAAALTASAGSNLTVDESAKLYLANAQAGNSYTIVEGFTDATAAEGWYTNTDNIIVNKLLTAESTGDTVSIVQDTDSKVLKSAAIPNLVSKVVNDGLLTTDESDDVPAGANYIAMATSGLSTDDQSIAILNNGAQAAEKVGATANALKMATAFSEAAQSRLSFINMPGENKKDNVWVMYSREQGSVDGRRLAGGNTHADYKNNFNGITVGYDFAKKGKWEHGVAISYGSGKGSARAVNERDKYQGGGISYYRSMKQGDTNLLIDVGGYAVSHDVKGLLETKPKTNMITLGVSEEYRKDIGNGGVLVPHVGLRHTYVNTPSYNSNYNGKKAFHYKPDSNHVFTLPIGIGFMRQVDSHGWKYNIGADLSYVGVLGGSSAKMEVTIPGLAGSDTVAYDVVDRSAIKSTLGVEAENDRMKWGVSYSFKGSSHEKNHRIAAGISWKF